MIFAPSLDSRIKSLLRHEADGKLLFDVLSGVATSAVGIWQHLSSAGTETWSDTNSLNKFGEASKNIDLHAKELIASQLKALKHKIRIITEEDTKTSAAADQTYALLVDPIDGSKHVHYQSSCGTFFSLADSNRRNTPISGYALYGYKLTLVIAVNADLLICEYNPRDRSFLAVSEHYTMPLRGNVYSINDADIDDFPSAAQDTIARLRQTGYKARYNGVLVADLHRILLEGGLFLSPVLKSGKTKTKKYFEALAIAHIMQAAGGLTANTYKWNPDAFLGAQDEELFSSVPLIFGSKHEVNNCKVE